MLQIYIKIQKPARGVAVLFYFQSIFIQGQLLNNASEQLKIYKF